MSVSLIRSRALLLAACGLFAVGAARADPHDRERMAAHQHLDTHFNHNHAYLERGYTVRELPRARVEVVRPGPGGEHFFFYGGVWYAPRGPGFVVVGAPIGLFIPVLPAFYTTLWVGGLAYYYANDAYYVYRGPEQGYEVVAPPDERGLSTQPPPPAPAAAAGNEQVFMYPKNGQSAEQQAKDRYECHRWASGETGYDPTASGGGVPPEQSAAKRADYHRAMSACLEGRGYSVK